MSFNKTSFLFGLRLFNMLMEFSKHLCRHYYTVQKLCNMHVFEIRFQKCILQELMVGIKMNVAAKVYLRGFAVTSYGEFFCASYFPNYFRPGFLLYSSRLSTATPAAFCEWPRRATDQKKRALFVFIAHKWPPLGRRN